MHPTEHPQESPQTRPALSQVLHLPHAVVTARPQPATLTLADWFTPFTYQSQKPTVTNFRGYDWSDHDLASGGPVVIADPQPSGRCEQCKRAVRSGPEQSGHDQPGRSQHAVIYAKLTSWPIFFASFQGFDKGSAFNNPQETNFNFGAKTHHLHGAQV